MTLTELRIAGYRSVRDLTLPLSRVNVITGPNGCGKSNLYRSICLLARAAQGDLARALAHEGGMPSVLWAGPRRKRELPVRIAMGFTSEHFSYELRLGLPTPTSGASRAEPSRFLQDPEVKEEAVWAGLKRRPSATLMTREDECATLVDDEGHRVAYPLALEPTESILSQLREPHRYPELSALRETMRQWRFYHQFRTDPESPLRHPRVGVRTPVLDHDGADLAAALQTIREVGDRAALERAIDLAFPGSALGVDGEEGRFELSLSMPGLHRPLRATEFSDGTLRYLCLVAALLSPRPPALLALNEPETSLHPDLLDPLAELIAQATDSAQLWVTTHSRYLAEAIADLTGQPPVDLLLEDGQTVLADADGYRFA